MTIDLHPRGWRHWVRTLFTTVVLALSICVAVSCSAPTADTHDDQSHRVVDTSYGTVTMTGPVTRVVALSADWLGTMTALKAPIVGYRTDGPASTVATAPWLEDSIPPAATRLTGSLNVAGIAALHPDLIVGPTWLVDHDAYEQLSSLAPTLIDSDSSEGTKLGSWQRQLTLAATALDRDPAPIADALTTQITSFTTAHQSINGRLFALSAVAGNQVAVISSPHASASKLLSALGFRLLDLPATGPGDRTVISPENATLLDRAYLLIIGSANPHDHTLAQFTSRRSPATPTLVLDLATLNAFNVPDASSIPTILTKLGHALPE